jgi:glycosyltransferase involved in cell wall biosynthesis
MRFVFASYVTVNEFDNPAKWLKRIEAFTGILTALAQENEVHSIQQINFTGIYQQEGVQYHFKKYPKNLLRFFPLALHRYIKKLNPEIIVIQGLHWPFQILQLRMIVGPNVKIILQHRADKPFLGYKKSLQQLADRYVDAYLFGSKNLAKNWLNAGNIKSVKKILEIPGLSSIFYPLPKESALANSNASGNPIFFWAGRLNSNKDPLTVLKAFLKFTVLNSSAMLYMSYQTEELLGEISALLNQHPNGKRVQLIGNIPHHELLYWLNSADYLLSASHYEGGGTVLCEALSVGCIPIVTDIPSFRMLTNNGENGFLYEPGDVDGLLKLLIITETLNINEYRQAAITYFNSNLSFEAIARNMKKMVENLK